MKNEEILSIVTLLIVIITAVSVLSLASADTNPKNLTVDSDQIVRPAQKAKTNTPAILIGTTALITTIPVATLLAAKSKTGELALKHQSLGELAPKSLNLSDISLIPSTSLSVLSADHIMMMIMIISGVGIIFWNFRRISPRILREQHQTMIGLVELERIYHREPSRPSDVSRAVYRGALRLIPISIYEMYEGLCFIIAPAILIGIIAAFTISFKELLIVILAIIVITLNIMTIIRLSYERPQTIRSLTDQILGN